LIPFRNGTRLLQHTSNETTPPFLCKKFVNPHYLEMLFKKAKFFLKKHLVSGMIISTVINQMNTCGPLINNYPKNNLRELDNCNWCSAIQT